MCYREDLGFRFISEQVSHHPPISAFYSEGLNKDFIFHGSIYPKLKFWGKSIEAEPRGTITLELLKWVWEANAFYACMFVWKELLLQSNLFMWWQNARSLSGFLSPSSEIIDAFPYCSSSIMSQILWLSKSHFVPGILQLNT